MIRKTNGRLTVCCTILGLLLAFIWGNSLLPGHISGAFSDWVKEILRQLLPFLFGNGPDGSGGGLLRKIAHFSEFAALGACFCWLYAMLMTKQYRPILCAAAAGVLAACVDETIQRFVPDRGPSLKDVAIDSSGVLTGLVLLYLGHNYLKKRSTK